LGVSPAPSYDAHRHEQSDEARSPQHHIDKLPMRGRSLKHGIHLSLRNICCKIYRIRSSISRRNSVRSSSSPLRDLLIARSPTGCISPHAPSAHTCIAHFPDSASPRGPSYAMSSAVQFRPGWVQMPLGIPTNLHWGHFDHVAAVHENESIDSSDGTCWRRALAR